jgi:tripartite-type tricarboxylate transporter receptor subunit TctC
VEARMQQPYLEKMLGVPMVVNYMPGAGGALAWTKFAQMKPDGQTVCGINIPHIILQPLSQKDVAFKTEDLKPLSLFESTPIGLAVKKESKINSLKEFVDFAKANPGKVTVGMSGKLSGHHMASLQFEKMNSLKLTQVTFTGAAPQVTALLGGHVEAIWGNSSDLVSYTTEMKILAIGTEKRMETLPGVPTFQELGMKFYPRIDRGVAVPKATPADITAKLEKAFLDTVNKDDYISKIMKAGFVPLGLNSQQSIKYITEQTEIFKKLLIEHDLLLKK